MIDPGAPVDAVYTWVDGERPEYRDLVARYAGRPRDRNPERTRDGYDLLRYSLRSLSRYAPWIRNVVLFTARPHVPAWLADHPRIRVVHHDEVMDPAILPTFNSRCIESHLHLVPGLSETFLYVNDDYLFGAPTTLEDFFEGGRLRVMGTLLGERLPFMIYEERFALYSFGLGHTPLLVHKPWWEEMLAAYAPQVAATRGHRFRRPDSLSFERLYCYWHLSRPEIPTEVVPIWRLYGFHRFHKLTNSVAAQRRGLAALERDRPKFYCLNDDQGDHPDPEVVALVRDFLDRTYPEPSVFER